MSKIKEKNKNSFINRLVFDWIYLTIVCISRISFSEHVTVSLVFFYTLPALFFCHAFSFISFLFAQINLYIYCEHVVALYSVVYCFHFCYYFFHCQFKRITKHATWKHYQLKMISHIKYLNNLFFFSSTLTFFCCFRLLFFLHLIDYCLTHIIASFFSCFDRILFCYWHILS